MHPVIRQVDDHIEHGAGLAQPGTTPVVSVIMVTYNHADYLAEAIESVLTQETCFPCELLIGDDASNDSTKDIALQYAERYPERIRVFVGRANVGQHRNYARLVAASRGEFIAYCDGDDFWSDADKLQHQVDHLRANPRVGAVHTDFDTIRRINGAWRRSRRSLARWANGRAVPAGSIFERLLAGNFIQTCTICMRAELVREFMTSGQLKPEYSVNDWPLFLHIAAQSEIDFLPQSTAVYRKAAGSLTNSGPSARACFVARYVPMVEDFCARYGVADRVRIAALSIHYRQLASFSVLAGDIGEFERARIWLSANDAAFMRSWRGRMLPVLAHSKPGRKVLSLVQEMRESIRDRRGEP